MSPAKWLCHPDQQRAAGPCVRARRTQASVGPGKGCGFGPGLGASTALMLCPGIAGTTVTLIHGALSVKHSHCPRPRGFTARGQEIQQAQLLALLAPEGREQSPRVAQGSAPDSPPPPCPAPRSLFCPAAHAEPTPSVLGQRWPVVSHTCPSPG